MSSTSARSLQTSSSSLPPFTGSEVSSRSTTTKLYQEFYENSSESQSSGDRTPRQVDFVDLSTEPNSSEFGDGTPGYLDEDEDQHDEQDGQDEQDEQDEEDEDDSSSEASTILTRAPLVPQLRISYARTIKQTLINTFHSGLVPTDYQRLIDQDYDNRWMHRYRINEAALDTFVSKHKLCALVSYGALKIGDHLYVEKDYEVNQVSTRLLKTAVVSISDTPCSSKD